MARIKKCGGVVLCGGQSTRMGVPKATLPFGNETMLQRVIRILAEEVSPVVVVAAQLQELPKLPGETIVARDRQQNQGPLEGIAVGLAAIAPYADAAYVTSCDVPLLKRDFVRRIVQLLDDFDIAVPQEDKYHHPLAAVYRTTVLPIVETLLREERRRPFFLFQQARTRSIDVQQMREVDQSLDSLRNVNHPEDYRGALRVAGFDTAD